MTRDGERIRAIVRTRGKLVRTAASRASAPGGQLYHIATGVGASRTGRNVRARCGATCLPLAHEPDPDQPYRVCRKCKDAPVPQSLQGTKR